MARGPDPALGKSGTFGERFKQQRNVHVSERKLLSGRCFPLILNLIKMKQSITIKLHITTTHDYYE